MSIARKNFELAFQVACRKNNVRAAYLIFDNDDPANPRAVRMHLGGESTACALLGRVVEAGKFIVAAEATDPAYEQRLDELFVQAFAKLGADHPAMHDYALLKMELKRLRALVGALPPGKG